MRTMPSTQETAMRVRAKTVLSRFTYANIVSTLAVVLVIGGGTAYAANTVFSTDIVDGEVKFDDLANNSVSSLRIQDNQVMTVDVRDDVFSNGGLTAADLRADSVTVSEIATDAVGTGEIATNA